MLEKWEASQTLCGALTAVRHVPYADQEAFYLGEGSHEETQSATSSSVDW